MKKLLKAAVMIACFVGVRVQAEDDYIVIVHPVRGPLRSNPAWNEWSTNIVWQLYSTRNMPDDLGYRLMTDDIAQPATMTNDTVWTVTEVTRKPDGPPLSLSRLRYSQDSSDPDSLLANFYAPTNALAIYSRRALGIIYGPTGPGNSDQIVDQGNAANLVDAIYFVGMQAQVVVYNNPTEYTNANNWIMGFLNFSTTLTCTVVDENEGVRAIAMRTLETRNAPIAPDMTGEVVENIFIASANFQGRRTAILRSRPYADRGSWMVEASFNANDIIPRLMNGQTYFDCVFEGPGRASDPRPLVLEHPQPLPFEPGESKTTTPARAPEVGERAVGGT